MGKGYLALAVAVLGLGFIGIFHKLGDHRKCRPAAINVAVFFWAAAMTSAYVVSQRGLQVFSSTPSILALISGVCGLFASVAILSFQSGLRFGKIATSWVVINLSTAVPTVLSLAIYKEEISLKKTAVLILIAISMLLLWKDKQVEERRRKALESSARNVPGATSEVT